MKYTILIVIFLISISSFSLASVNYGPDGRKIYTHLCDQLSHQNPEYQECLIERDYFSQFEPNAVNHFHTDFICKNHNPNSEKIHHFMIILGKIITKSWFNPSLATPLIHQILVQNHNYIKNLDQKCFIQDVLNLYFGKKPQLSTLNFSEIYQTIQEHKLQSRSNNYTEYEEFYSPINNLLSTPRSEDGIGKYLFATADWEQTKLFLAKKPYLALRVLKAWDTHWQEFATIENTAPELKFHDPALSINKQKLHLTLDLRDQKFENIDQTITFSLNQDGSRSLSSCKKEKQKIWIHNCDNPSIQIKTLLK